MVVDTCAIAGVGISATRAIKSFFMSVSTALIDPCRWGIGLARTFPAAVVYANPLGNCGPVLLFQFS